VRRAGRAVADDGGEFYPLGFTMMWSLQGAHNEWDRYKANVDYMAGKGFDFKRPLTEVAWNEPLRLDPQNQSWWHDTLRQDIDYAHSVGVRSGITLRGKGTDVDHLWLAREVAGIIADGRTDKVLCCEMENEYWNGGDPLDELVAMAREMAARIPNLLALSAPADDPASTQTVRDAALKAAVALFVRHTERSTADYGWRDVRQAYDFHEDAPMVAADWEGPGPSASGSSNSSPLQLALKRILAAMNGAPIWVLHTGTGVYGDGKPGSTGPRPPNFWEIENIDAIIAAVRGVDPLLPLDLPNWRSDNSVGWPFQPHAFWEGNTGEGVNKAPSAQAPDGRVMQVALGVRNHVRLTANYAIRDVTVRDPLTLAVVAGIENRSFGQGESVDLPGGGQDAMVGYVIHGRR
jgi:hypothetical protein